MPQTFEPSMKSRMPLFVGGLMLVLGSAALVIGGGVLATFVLELVSRTISPGKAELLESVEYSWGTMTWGHMGSDYTLVAVAFVLLAVGHFLILPATIGRIKAPDAGPSLLPKLALVGASVLTLLAAASFLYMAIAMRNTFGTLAATGVADPMSLGESLPVRTSRVFVVSLVAAQVLVLVAAVAVARKPVSDSPIQVRSILAMLSCIFFAFLAMGIVSTRLGPIQSFNNLITSGSAGDPAMLAGEISYFINMLLLAAPVLGVSAILSLLAVLIPARRRA